MVVEAEQIQPVAEFDHETRLAVAHSACIMLALDPELSPKDAVADACQVFSAVFPKEVKNN